MWRHTVSAKLNLFVLLVAFGGAMAQSQSNFSIYSDQLNNGFQNWSWGAYDFRSTSPVHSGTYAISLSGAWNGISFWHQDFNPMPYTNLTFWANGGAAGGQIVQVYWQYNGSANSGPGYQLPPLPANSWQQFNLPFSALGVAGITNLNRLNFQLTSFGTTNSFSLDDMNLAATMPLPVQINVDTSQTLRDADARWFGLNAAVWDGYFDTTYTSSALSELGTLILRFPGGSLSDEYHWATGKTLTNTWVWGTTFNNFVHIATNAGVQAMITVNYGTGTSNEAAAWVKSANVTNHFNFKNWEIGNECYGTWETDSNTYSHDPYTYAVRASGYIALMKQADPTIKIGVPVVTGEDNSANGYNSHPAYNARTGTSHNGWTPVVLATLKSLGVTPDFLVHHVYPEYQSDNDQTLLQASASWAIDASNLRQQITDYFGAGGTNIELLCTENNADAGSQGKQSTGIVNGLYLADSLAQLMKTEFNGFIWWDLRNGSDTNGDFGPSLYGWRTNGDLGIIGNANTRYPTFYAFKLMRYFARPGDTVLNATSDYFLLSSYAARKADGALALLVINKDSSANLAAQIMLTNFIPSSSAIVRSYGIAQDEATRNNSPIPDAQDISTNDVFAGAQFTHSFPPYSLTLFTFAPAPARLSALLPQPGQFVLQLQGQPGTPYIVERSPDLSAWTLVSTNTLVGSVLNLTNAISPGASQQFWRAVWQP
jgi:alpha-N-arabinofuranosidase